MAVRIAVGGMQCGACVAAVERALAPVIGAAQAQVAVGQVLVTDYLGETQALRQAIEDAGFIVESVSHHG